MKQNENNDGKELNLEEKVLEAYFFNRCPRDPNPGLSVYVRDDKTTQQIIDDLAETLTVDDKTVVRYMLQNNYVLTTQEDGSPIWVIYRIK